MARGGRYSIVPRAGGSTVTAEIYNEDHRRHQENLIPERIDDFSDTLDQLQQTRPVQVGPNVQPPTNLSEELMALRDQIKRITGKSVWYEEPARDLETSVGRQIFTGMAAPQSDVGETGDLFIYQSGSTLAFYVRRHSGWGSAPDLSFSDTVGGGGGVNLTFSAFAPSGGADGDVHIRSESGVLRFYKRAAGAWPGNPDLTFIGRASTTYSSGEPTGGSEGDIHFQSADRTLTVWERGPDGSDPWSPRISHAAPSISQLSTATIDPSADYIAFSDTGDSGNPDKRTTLSDAMNSNWISRLPIVDSGVPTASDELLFHDHSANTPHRITMTTLTEVLGADRSGASEAGKLPRLNSVGRLQDSQVPLDHRIFDDNEQFLSNVVEVVDGDPPANGDRLVTFSQVQSMISQVSHPQMARHYLYTNQSSNPIILTTGWKEIPGNFRSPDLAGSAGAALASRCQSMKIWIYETGSTGATQVVEVMNRARFESSLPFDTVMTAAVIERYGTSADAYALHVRRDNENDAGVEMRVSSSGLEIRVYMAYWVLYPGGP